MIMKKYFAYLGLLILPALLIYGFWRKEQLKKYQKYTITTTIRQIRTLKNGLQIEHFYFVEGKKYSHYFSKDERVNIIYPGGRYLLRYSKKNPDISEVLWKYPVPDSIKNAPSNGWDNIPSVILPR